MAHRSLLASFYYFGNYLNNLYNLGMKVVLTLFILLNSAWALPDIAPSRLDLVSGPEELCSEGVMKVVGEKGSQSLVIGQGITFSLNTQEEMSTVADGKCRETIQKKVEENKLIQTTTISQCASEVKKLEGVTIEEVVISKDQLVYKHSDGKKISTCLYKRHLK